ncbi:uncharacterized protein [Drosophila bipectinata]|uniref:uncharacterized protein n=1 Tax=Drosophila bipectinata TaxID=42026 RepID=UPI0038B2E8C2
MESSYEILLKKSTRKYIKSKLRSGSSAAFDADVANAFIPLLRADAAFSFGCLDAGMLSFFGVGIKYQVCARVTSTCAAASPCRQRPHLSGCASDTFKNITVISQLLFAQSAIINHETNEGSERGAAHNTYVFTYMLRKFSTWYSSLMITLQETGGYVVLNWGTSSKLARFFFK